MIDRRRPSISMYMMPFIVSLALAGVATVSACSEKEEVYEPSITDPSLTPTMVTSDVNTLVSDSGYTRYRITSPLWQMFEESETPSWKFPDGLYIEKYTDDMSVEATIRCDSATYFSRKRLWRLDGNVNIKNTLGDKFLTEQLFWDQDFHKVYSDSFIHIERSNRIIEGYGFNSNEQMTDYDILRPSGIFPVPERRQQASDEPAATLSVGDDAAEADKPVEKERVENKEVKRMTNQ
ncbi:MAG: LPS export ABC transporter periplasmic protein LptC [Muribaculaceae bacterium]|nr:LPS export ABC transporter periplasmic protein LptC [Muribaculaceae bacterium]